MSVAPRPRMRGVLLAPLQARTWLAAAYLLTAIVSGTVAFSVLVTGIAAGVSLAVMWVGIPLLAATIVLWRWAAGIERRWIGLTLGSPIADPYRPLPVAGWRRRWSAILRDPATWKDLAYWLLHLPLGIVYLTVTAAVWTTALGLLTIPAWYWALPDGRAPIVSYGDDRALAWVDSPGTAALAAAAGVVAAIAAAWVTRGLGALHAGIARGLLGCDRRQLEARVVQLNDARSRAVDGAAADRRRIERDLHDGAQQRLVALAMGLGMAREKLASDPQAAGQLVAEAHEEAKRALVDLRDLARGIHPAILTEQGLDPALSAVAARSPVPVEVAVEVGRLPGRLESGVYFMVAEALANVAKHATATRAAVRVWCEGDRICVEVEDDGAGGADPSGNGLRGLADRAAALDGRMTVSSPPGGPTVVRAELPCEC